MKFLIIGTIVTGACKFAGAKVLAVATMLGNIPFIGGVLGFIPKIIGSVLAFVGWFFWVFIAIIVAILLFKLFKTISRRVKKQAITASASSSSEDKSILGKSGIFK